MSATFSTVSGGDCHDQRQQEEEQHDLERDAQQLIIEVDANLCSRIESRGSCRAEADATAPAVRVRRCSVPKRKAAR